MVYSTNTILAHSGKMIHIRENSNDANNSVNQITILNVNEFLIFQTNSIQISRPYLMTK